MMMGGWDRTDNPLKAKLIILLKMYFIFIFYRESTSGGGGRKREARIRRKLEAVRAEPDTGL